MRGRRHYVDTIEILEPTSAPAANQPTQSVTTWASYSPTAVTVPGMIEPVSDRVAERYSLTAADRAATFHAPTTDVSALAGVTVGVGVRVKEGGVVFEIVAMDEYDDFLAMTIKRAP